MSQPTSLPVLIVKHDVPQSVLSQALLAARDAANTVIASTLGKQDPVSNILGDASVNIHNNSPCQVNSWLIVQILLLLLHHCLLDHILSPQNYQCRILLFKNHLLRKKK